MKITFEQTSKKKRRWLIQHDPSSFPWLNNDMCIVVEKTLFSYNKNCRIIKNLLPGTDIWFIIHVEFKNDSDEAAFMLWASNGVEV